VGAVRRRGRRVRVELDETEATLLVAMTSQVIELLDVAEPPSEEPELTADPDDLEALLDVSVGPVEPPTDPALRRLLPDGYRNDDVAAGEFRRLTESSLRATKRAALAQVAEDISNGAVQSAGGVRLALDSSQVQRWLPALTDLRLVLGTRLDVTEDMDEVRASLPADSLQAAELAIYDWLSWLQEAMVGALTDD
jgi:Domain of unknown function (DUF2017)